MGGSVRPPKGDWSGGGRDTGAGAGNLVLEIAPPFLY
jgi:hypothetical protein